MPIDTPSTAPAPGCPPLPVPPLPASDGACGDVPVPRVCSQALLRGARELHIEHGGALYRLRITALGRLILTK